jgi:hypothetical protein
MLPTRSFAAADGPPVSALGREPRHGSGRGAEWRVLCRSAFASEVVPVVMSLEIAFLMSRAVVVFS